MNNFQKAKYPVQFASHKEMHTGLCKFFTFTLTTQQTDLEMSIELLIAISYIAEVLLSQFQRKNE